MANTAQTATTPSAKRAPAKAPEAAKDAKDAKKVKGAEAASPAQATEGAKQVVFEDTATTLVRCGGAPVPGLFVLFRCVAPEDDGVHAKVMKAISNALAAHEPEQEQPANSPVIKASYEYAYHPAFVDSDGFLQPLLPDSNPWFEIHQAEEAKREAAKKKKKKTNGAAGKTLNPHSIKLAEGTDVDLVLVRHPEPALARDLADFLNLKRDRKNRGFSSWKIQKVRRKVQVEESETGKQLFIELPTTAQSYLPLGHRRYAEWTLYYEMPHKHLPSVQEAVNTLARDLGTLRYPVGDLPPYGPNGENQPFDLTIKASLHQFQLDAAAGSAFRVESRADAHDQAQNPRASAAQRGQKKASFAYLLGNDVTASPRLEGAIDPGVADQKTASAIVSWLDQQLRKRGHVLVETSALDKAASELTWNVWGRPELVASIEMWRELVLSLGCPYGISCGHTFRNLDEPGGIGKSETSIHKTGMAVDLALVGDTPDKIFDYSRPRDVWPIRYEASWVRVSYGPYAKATKALEQARARRANAESKLTKFNEARESAQTALDQAKLDVDDATAKLEAARAALPPAPEPPPAAPLKKGSKPPKLPRDGIDPNDPLAAEKRDVLVKQKTLDEKTRARNKFDEAPKKNEQATLEKNVKNETEAEKNAQEHLDKLDQQDEDTKAWMRLRWRLYGHSTLDVFSHEASDDPTKDPVRELVCNALGKPAVQGGEWGIVQRLRKALLSYFPTQSEKAHAWVKPWAEELQKIASTLGAMTGAELIEKYFRDSVYQWNYNLYEADGGTTGTEKILPNEPEYTIEYLSAAAPKAVARFIPENARSFVNLTALAYLAGLRRIGANNAGFRDPKTDVHLTPKQQRAPTQKFSVNPVVFGTIAGLLERMKRPESAHIDDKIVVDGKGRVLERLPAEIDHEFMWSWTRETLALKPPFARPANAGTEVTIVLSIAPGAKEKIASLLDKFASKRFERDFIGDKLDGEAMPTIATGAEWKTAIEGEIDKLIAATAAADAAAAAEPPPPRDKGKGKAGDKQKKSTPKQTLDWTLQLRPIFDLSDTSPAGTPYHPPLTFYGGDTVEMPTPGIGRALEWWHYETEYASKVPWGQLLEEIGFSRAILEAGIPPQKSGDDLMAGYGCGFDPAKDLGEIKGGGRLDGPPENKRLDALAGG